MWTQVLVNLGGAVDDPSVCLWILGGVAVASHTHTAVVTAAAVGDDYSVRTHLSAYLLFITLIFLQHWD